MVPVGHIVHTSPHVSGLGTSGLTRVGYQEKQNFVKRWFTQRYRDVAYNQYYIKSIFLVMKVTLQSRIANVREGFIRKKKKF